LRQKFRKRGGKVARRCPDRRGGYILPRIRREGGGISPQKGGRKETESESTGGKRSGVGLTHDRGKKRKGQK